MNNEIATRIVLVEKNPIRVRICVARASNIFLYGGMNDKVFSVKKANFVETGLYIKIFKTLKETLLSGFYIILDGGVYNGAIILKEDSEIIKT